MHRASRHAAFRFAVFACFGVAVEILYTSFSAAAAQIADGAAVDWTLPGRSYAWMLPIYGSAALLFPPAYRRMRRWPLVARLAAYGAAILAVEFICGAALDLLIGRCPWEYHARFAVMGYIRLDYFPLWAAFGWAIERLHLSLQAE